MNLHDILHNLKSRMGITSLLPMQQKLVESTAAAEILIAPTGSGKTIAFTARMLISLPSPGSDSVKALVLAPSRELVIQIAEVVRTLACGYKTVALYGGHSMTDEVNSLNPLPDIVIATPGRMLDHLQRKQIELDRITALVIDEYDKSLELGFENEIKRILRRTGSPRLTILTSATKLRDIPEYLHLSKPGIIDVTADTLSPSERTDIVQVPSYERDKLTSLTDLILTVGPGKRSIIFVNHRESAQRVFDRLKTLHIPAAIYHGGLEQIDRANAIDMLANGTTPVLVATDLASRGLDIDGIDNVIHYHIPTTSESWTHRNGRTARQNATGDVYVITSDADNIPDYIRFRRTLVPAPEAGACITSPHATLFISAGKKEKISRGDIVGFLIANASLQASEIGKISLHDHNSLVAIPREAAKQILATIRDKKLKGHKTRFSLKY